jgi:hypothetical protein
MVIPITRKPLSTRRAAATELSTPPLMAVTTVAFFGILVLTEKEDVDFTFSLYYSQKSLAKTPRR